MSRSPTFNSACTTAEILEDVARALWAKHHDGESCSPEIPTETELCTVGSTIFESEGRSMAWLVLYPGVEMEQTSEPRLFLVGTAAAMVIDAKGVLTVQEAQNKGRPVIQVKGGLLGVRLVGSDIETAHADWLALPKDQRPKHPLVPVVQAWFQRPTPVNRNARTDRMIPVRLGMAEPTHPRAGKLLTPALHAAPDGQGMLPGFGEHINIPTPALPLAPYDLGIGPDVEGRWRGAPLALRLWIEAVLLVPLDAWRLDSPVVMQVTLRELLGRLYPGRRPSPAEYWPRLMAAVKTLESPEARIPWGDTATGKGGLRRVVNVSKIPRGPWALDDDVRIVVDLPPGAEDGPIVSPKLPL